MQCDAHLLTLYLTTLKPIGKMEEIAKLLGNLYWIRVVKLGEDCGIELRRQSSSNRIGTTPCSEDEHHHDVDLFVTLILC